MTRRISNFEHESDRWDDIAYTDPPPQIRECDGFVVNEVHDVRSYFDYGDSETYGIVRVSLEGGELPVWITLCTYFEKGAHAEIDRHHSLLMKFLDAWMACWLPKHWR